MKKISFRKILMYPIIIFTVFLDVICHFVDKVMNSIDYDRM